MSSYSFKIFKAQPTRFILSVGGIGLCIILMLFLLASYNGVKIGSLEYITQNETDLWVMQKNASNIMRFRLKLKLFYLYPDKDYIENFQKLLYHTTAIELHYGYAVRFDRYDPAACFLKMNACRLAECIDKDGVLHAIFKGLWFYPPFRDVVES